MAAANISTNRLLDTMEWAKKFNFQRQSALGNFLEPAKTSASIVKQTMLSPPFSWWWNSSFKQFTLNSTTAAATITNTVLTGGIATYTTQAAHDFDAGQFVTVIGTTNGAGIFNVFNALILTVPSPTTFTIAIDNTNVTTAADTGSATVSPQDYSVDVPNFGWIDSAAVKDITQTAPKWIELENKMILASDTVSARPRFISPLNQDSTTGAVTFRFMPAPSADYPVTMVVQNAASQFESIADTWAPIPDYLSYIYNWGFLALMWMFADDPRWIMANQKFIAHLLGASEGLSETERNIFLNNWNNLTAGQNISQQQGFQARGV